MSRLRKIFDKDYADTISNIKQDKNVKQTMIRVLEDMNKGVKVVQLDDANWTIKRAYKDGQHSIVNELLNLLTME